MKRNKSTRRNDVDARWAKLAGEDVSGIDSDIETLVGRLQDRYGYTQESANAELVRRLSFALPETGPSAQLGSRMEMPCF